MNLAWIQELAHLGSQQCHLQWLWVIGLDSPKWRHLQQSCWFMLYCPYTEFGWNELCAEWKLWKPLSTCGLHILHNQTQYCFYCVQRHNHHPSWSEASPVGVWKGSCCFFDSEGTVAHCTLLQVTGWWFLQVIHSSGTAFWRGIYSTAMQMDDCTGHQKINWKEISSTMASFYLSTCRWKPIIFLIISSFIHV